MSMKNPTSDAASQFNPKPFDILPNKTGINGNPTVLYTQFKTKPYDILPNIIGLKDNPTDMPASTSQFKPSAPTLKYINNLYDTNTSTAYFTGSFGAEWKTSEEYFKDYTGKQPNTNITSWVSSSIVNTNKSLETVGAKAAGFAASALGGFTGIPYLAQVGQAFTGRAGADKLSGQYITLTHGQLRRVPGVLYADFRSRLGIQSESDKTGDKIISAVTSKRLDGTSAIIRGSVRGAIYAGASVSPLGPYSVFNLETLYGWGEHDNPNAIRSDFTMRSHVATKWKNGSAPTITTNADGSTTTTKNPGKFIPTRNPIELATPFRGDKISVIDFGQRSLKHVYDWKRLHFSDKKALGRVLNTIRNATDLTQDFIKFYFTGPKLQPGNEKDSDDIIIFRAAITSFSENFSPSWSDTKMIGRADPNYIYSGVTRDLSIDFDIYATDRDELKPIYRKLNALAGYTAPTYDDESIAMEAPWMRITIGDLFVQTPVVLTSLSYTYAMDAPWEINIEKDPTMMQVPKKISVSCGFNVVSDSLPQKGGRFWALAKQFEESGEAKAGNDNWLSDSKGNIDPEEAKVKRTSGGTARGNRTNRETEINQKLQFKGPINESVTDGADIPLPN